MSFALTTQQMRNRTKDVTRRLGWAFLRPGDVVMACVQCRGLKRGQHVERIHPIRIVDTRWEPLEAITAEEVRREGFPEWTPAQFIAFYCAHNRCTPKRPVNRIEFEHIGDRGGGGGSCQT
jgi:hypothetical protein